MAILSQKILKSIGFDKFTTKSGETRYRTPNKGVVRNQQAASDLALRTMRGQGITRKGGKFVSGENKKGYASPKTAFAAAQRKIKTEKNFQAKIAAGKVEPATIELLQRIKGENPLGFTYNKITGKFKRGRKIYRPTQALAYQRKYDELFDTCMGDVAYKAFVEITDVDPNYEDLDELVKLLTKLKKKYLDKPSKKLAQKGRGQRLQGMFDELIAYLNERYEAEIAAMQDLGFYPELMDCLLSGRAH